MQHRLELPPTSCWTGRVASWSPFSPPPQAPPAGHPGGATQPGALPPLKTAARGVWLRSEQGGVLTVQWRAGGAPTLLTFTLRNAQQLIRAPLQPGAFAFRLLCPAHGAPPPAAGGSSGHLLFLTLSGPAADVGAGASSSLGTQGSTFAVHFDTAPAGRECGALLHAIQQGLLSAPAEEQPPPAAPRQRQAASGPAAAAGGAGGGQGSGQQQQQQQQGRHGLPVPPAELQAAAAAVLAGRQQQAGDGGGSDSGALFEYADEASLAAAIQDLQADPSFQSHLAMWEGAVAQVEALLLADRG